MDRPHHPVLLFDISMFPGGHEALTQWPLTVQHNVASKHHRSGQQSILHLSGLIDAVSKSVRNEFDIL